MGKLKTQTEALVIIGLKEYNHLLAIENDSEHVLDLFKTNLISECLVLRKSLNNKGRDNRMPHCILQADGVGKVIDILRES